MHDLVEQLCNVTRVENGQVLVPEQFCAQLKAMLPEAYRVSPTVFRDLLLMWSEFDQRKYQPAAGQVLELLRVLPLLEEEKAALASEDKARAMARSDVPKPKKPDGLGGKVTLGSVGPRKKN